MDQCGIQCIEADVLQRDSLHEPLDMVNVVYNLASTMPADGPPVDFLDVNTAGLKNLLEEAEEHGVTEFVHLSTLDVFGFRKRRVGPDDPCWPEHPYQRAKLEAERLLLAYSRDHTEMRIKIVRAARAVGARDRTLTLPLLRMIQGGRVVLPRGAESAMSFSHPKDIAQGMLRAATHGKTGQVVMVKSFDATVEGLSSRLAEVCRARVSIGKEGMLSKSRLPSYTASQIRAGLAMENQASWDSISFRPAFDAEKTAKDIADWYVKEPWITEESSGT